MENINLYYFLYPFIGLVSIIGIYLNKEKFFFKIISIFLILISIFRFDTGYDYFWYWIVGDKTLINDPIVHEIYINLEFGIQKIYDITRWLGHPQYFFVITGLITFILLYRTFEKESRSPLILLTLFFFVATGFFEFNTSVMQVMAVSIIFYFTKLSYERKYLKFILAVLFACLFHSSAILCLFFLFIPRKEMDRKLWIFGSIFLFIGLKYIFPFLVLKLHPTYYYLISYSPELVYINLFNLIIFMLLFLFIIFIETLKKKVSLPLINEKFNLKEYEIYQFNIFGIGIILSLMLAYIYKGDLSRRIGIYFLVYGFLVAGNYIEIFNKKVLKNIKLIVIFTISLIKIYLMLRGGQPFLLVREPYIDKYGIFAARPNSVGLRLFFNKKYEDMSSYLPGEIKFERKR